MLKIITKTKTGSRGPSTGVKDINQDQGAQAQETKTKTKTKTMTRSS